MSLRVWILLVFFGVLLRNMETLRNRAIFRCWISPNLMLSRLRIWVSAGSRHLLRCVLLPNEAVLQSLLLFQPPKKCRAKVDPAHTQRQEWKHMIENSWNLMQSDCLFGTSPLFWGKKTWGKNTTQLGSEFHRRKRSSKNWGLCNLAGCPFNTVAAVPTSSTVFFSFTMNWWLIPTVWSQWHTNLTFSCNERYVCTVAGCIPNLIVPPQLHHHDCGNINILIIPHHKRTICWMFPACIFFPSSFGAQFFFIQPWTQITLNNSLFWTTWCPQH